MNKYVQCKAEQTADSAVAYVVPITHSLSSTSWNNQKAPFSKFKITSLRTFWGKKTHLSDV
jgi:hypothetical protein